MATKVTVPLLGEGVEEVILNQWLKQEGDTVEEMEPLVEVNTDKVDTEIPAPAAGTLLKIVVDEPGTAVPVGAVLAWIGEPGEAIPNESGTAEPLTPQAAPTPAAAAEQVEPAPPVTPTVEEKTAAPRGFISPVVARIAAEHGIDLSQVKGTGRGGRITKKDVLAYIERGPAPGAPAPAPPVTAPPATAAPVTPGTGTRDTLIPHTAIRRRIAEHMVRSKHTSPHVLTVMEADMSRVLAHRQANKEAFARDGVRLTLTAYFLQAIVAGLKAYPQVNSSWSDEGLIVHREINLGMATSLGEEGLIVPVIKNADTLSLLGMARAVNDLAERARAGQLQPDEVRGGTFTLTNHGISGSLFAFPVINQPQCGILGVGALQKRPVVVTDAAGSDAIAIRPMVYLSFVFDHRILDGAQADWFLAKVKETLENWR